MSRIGYISHCRKPVFFWSLRTQLAPDPSGPASRQEALFRMCVFRRLESVSSAAATSLPCTTAILGLVGVATRLTGGLPAAIPTLPLCPPGDRQSLPEAGGRCWVARSALPDSSPTLQPVKFVVINCITYTVC